jgi:hypothetical protein
MYPINYKKHSTRVAGSAIGFGKGIKRHPNKFISASLWAKRFVNEIKKVQEVDA